jgi:transcriptional regulator of acetoin/glycerol metabolism
LNLPQGHLSEHDESYDQEGNLISLEDVEKTHIRKALDSYSWNRENSAKALGIAQKTLYSKIKKYNLK